MEEDQRSIATLTDSLTADWMDEQKKLYGYVPIHMYEEKNYVTVHAFSHKEACLMKVVFHRQSGERTVERFDLQSGEMLKRRTAGGKD